MPYFLGVDLGTTYTAAAIARDGRTSAVELGTRTTAIPSVVYLRADETILTGDAASRRGATEPGRVAREFKRRIGDTTPILLGGSPYSADALMSKLLRWVVDAVSDREGERPAGIAVAHPANWGPYKQELLRQAIARADLDHVTTITEPEAAVTYYASQERIDPGSVIAVYDLGGGTFDAAVVAKTQDGVELLGTPEGIERLGGVDFDEAVFAHVVGALGGALERLDPDDPAAMAAVARLRAECVEAKEALSSDTEVSIPVLLPNVSTEVRLTRAELEAMIRPPLADSLTALRRALRAARVEPDDLRAVLLAGGSSRIPLVAQLVGAELGRPVAVDAHPKHGVALGAAQAAARAGGRPADDATAPSPPAAGDVGQPTVALGGATAAGAAAGAVAATATTAATAGVDREGAGAPLEPTAPGSSEVAPITPAGVPASARAAGDPPALARLEALSPAGGADPGTRPPPPVPSYRPDEESGRRSPAPLILGGLAAAVVLAVVAFFVFGGDDGDDTVTGATDGVGATVGTGSATDQPASGSTAASVVAPVTAAASVPATPPPASTPPASTAPPVCIPEDGRLCIEMTSVTRFGEALVIEWTPFNFDPQLDGFHAHFFWNTTRPEEAGTNAAEFGATPGVWELTAARPFVSEGALLLSARPPDATEVCVTPATSEHAVVDPAVFHCRPLPE